MYCPQCGTQNDNSAAFCGNCGTRLTNTVSQSTVGSISRPSLHPVTSAVKKLALSPLCLIAAVAFSLMIFLYISNAEVISVSVMGMIRGALDETGSLTSDVRVALSMLNGLARIFAFIVMIPNIIIAIGIWITIYSAFDNSKKSMSISGLGTIKTVISVVFVFNIIYVIIYIIFSLFFFSKITSIGASLHPLVFFVMLIMLGAMIFRLYCLNKMKELLDSLRYTISRKLPDVPSTFVAITSFISCGGYVILALIQGALSDWCGAVAFLCFGLLINKYKTVMQELQRIARTFADEENDNEGAIADNTVVIQNETKNMSSIKRVAVFGIIVAVVVAIIAFSFTYTAPNIDKQIVGKWQYGSNEEAVTEFKRNGTFIANAGTEYEETGTYTAMDGVITVIIDGGINEINYEVIDSDKIKVERSYITSDWERKYRWETLYRVD